VPTCNAESFLLIFVDFVPAMITGYFWLVEFFQPSFLQLSLPQFSSWDILGPSRGERFLEWRCFFCPRMTNENAPLG